MTTISRAISKHSPLSAVEILPETNYVPPPSAYASPAPSCGDQVVDDAQTRTVTASSCGRQISNEAHTDNATTELNGGHRTTGAQSRCAAVELIFLAAALDDLESIRKATSNRLREFDRVGLDASIYVGQLAAIEAIEHQATLALQRAMRQHPLGPWVKRTCGVGEKQAARLIAAIAGPSGRIGHNDMAGRPRRGPAELWAYCGYAPGQKRRKGVRSNWNAEAKMRAFLIAESCLKAKAKSPYGPVYDQARRTWADRDTTELHKHNHALRVVAKAILRDLFLEALAVGA